MASVRVLVLRAPGTNCDEETQFAWELAGARAERVHINRLRENPLLLRDYQILVVPGGFTYGDDVAAGKILANQLRHYLSEELQRFRDEGKLVLGICNGFQALLKAGLLVPPRPIPKPSLRLTAPDDPPNQESIEVVPATLAANAHGRFEARWVFLATTPGRCPFLAGYDRWQVPVAHGEGRFLCRDQATFQTLEQQGQIVLRYVDAEGRLAGYPFNPNGSQGNVAGICDITGRVLGLMPHPERHVLATQHPHWTRRGLAEEGAGLRLFRNAVAYFS
ncbi:MAG: phosphoribosylformylglycinamidine synthase I [Gemmatales bacterium]|nr:phosphoribosylformylglycinamidine synthase I [Gemmatales bacterium]MCS7161270.1 phosphoribosylformylglycinamidine synthase I [Gemmatales bacterium]MDW8176473.1 phosphoribosylformylglycinamidine synthase I [Gemmatales bacterium]MDW8222686.1 phosphoribosylformylglycinamidine synthase I [Gemmatales bacterium]